MRIRAAWALPTLFALACQSLPSLAPEAPATGKTTHQRKLGPPPPGYVRIVGEPVPGWQAADMLSRRRSSLGWQPLGPQPITGEFWSGNDFASGRVVSLAPHPSDPDIVYAASASGGIWKTTDGGTTWRPKTDELAILNHGCVALDPSDPETIYAGTGEYTTQSTGDGLFRSTDGGETWARIGTAAQVGGRCSEVIVDPTDPLTIHVTGGAGYVRSTDGGASWQTLRAGAASDLAMKTGDPNVLLLGAHGVGVFRSTDGGDTWNPVTNGLPTTDVARIVFAAGVSSPQTMYTAIVNTASGLRGLYVSTDSGQSWTQRTNTPSFPSPQGWYDVFLGVDPANANLLYAGGVFPSYAVAGVIKSTNGGQSWTDVTVSATSGQLHPDQHAVAFGADGAVWVGNDGGVWKSTDGAATWINTNATLALTQNYAIAVHPTDRAQVMGGTQDNGTAARQTDVAAWPQIVAGDGGFLAYDHEDPSRVYTTYVRLTVFRLEPSDFADITGPWSAEPSNFIAPLVMDPNDSSTLVGGTNRVWRTRNADGAATWTALSGDLGGGTLNALAVATGASDTIWAGGSNGKVFVTTNAATFIDRSAGLPAGQVSDVLVDPANPAVAYVSYYNTTGPRILKTVNQGASWQDLTGTLPGRVSVRALAVDWNREPDTLLVGSGAGVYWSTNAGASWEKDGIDLPNVNIGDLAIDFANGDVFAGTYGRGVWRANLASLLFGEPIFEDGFESGGTGAWSDAVP